MYPMTLAKQLEQKRPDIKLIQKLIQEHDTRKMREGVRYYENYIMKRQQYAVIDGKKVVDHEKPNNKIPNGWHKLLVDQKTAYLVGNPINFSTDNEQLLKHINEYLGEKFDDIANELVKKHRIKVRNGYIHTSMKKVILTLSLHLLNNVYQFMRINDRQKYNI